MKSYQDILSLNRSMVIAGLGGLFSGAYVAQLYFKYDQNSLTNALVVLWTEYAVYIPFLGALLYIENRHKYLDPITGKENISLFKQDMKKLAIAMSVSEVVYSVTKITWHYQFLQFAIAPIQASLASSLIGWAVFFVFINAIGDKIKLFRFDEKKSL